MRALLVVEKFSKNFSNAIQIPFSKNQKNNIATKISQILGKPSRRNGSKAGSLPELHPGRR